MTERPSSDRDSIRHPNSQRVLLGTPAPRTDPQRHERRRLAIAIAVTAVSLAIGITLVVLAFEVSGVGIERMGFAVPVETVTAVLSTTA